MDCDVFAAEWEARWNSHDLDRILSHYHEGIEFPSAKAEALVGTGCVIGKPPLRSYWAAALARQPQLRFAVQMVFHEHEMAVITYRNHRDMLAAETLHFGADGLVWQA